jgi:hypothetical protein
MSNSGAKRLILCVILVIFFIDFIVTEKAEPILYSCSDIGTFLKPLLLLLFISLF